MKIKKTYRAWLEFKAQGNSFSKENPDHKLTSSIKKAIKKNAKIDEDMSEKADDISIDFCAVDSEGNMVKDSNGKLVYKPEKLKEANKKNRALLKEVVEIEPSICNEIPKGLTEDEIEMFAGIVISEEKAVELCGNETKEITLNTSEQ